MYGGVEYGHAFDGRSSCTRQSIGDASDRRGLTRSGRGRRRGPAPTSDGSYACAVLPVVSAHIEMPPAVICALPVASTMTLLPDGQALPSEWMAM